eukprot:2625614-Rhodomonas_salina.1
MQSSPVSKRRVLWSGTYLVPSSSAVNETSPSVGTPLMPRATRRLGAEIGANRLGPWVLNDLCGIERAAPPVAGCIRACMGDGLAFA